MSADGPITDEEDRSERPETGGIIVLAVLFEGGLAPLAILVGRVLGRPPLTGFAWSGRDAFAGALATLPMLALLGVLVRWPAGPLAKIKQFFDHEVRPLLRSRPWHDLLLIAAAAGVGEELLFRGAIQGALGGWLGPWAGLAVASLIFGACHPITPAYALIAAGLGAYLGVVWLLTGNLLAPIVAHCVYDFLALLVLLRAESRAAA